MEIKKSQDNSKLKENDNIFENCDELDPLKLVDRIERFYHKIVTNSKQNDFLILSNFKNSQERKLDLIDFEVKTQNSKILKKIKEINCIKIVEDNIYLGLKDGCVYMYQIETGLEKETFREDNFNISVSVINTKENLYLLVGYENGCINIFDIENKNKRLFKKIDNIHKSKILAIESILIEKNNIQLISFIFFRIFEF